MGAGGGLVGRGRGALVGGMGGKRVTYILWERIPVRGGYLIGYEFLYIAYRLSHKRRVKQHAYTHIFLSMSCSLYP
jgi:hypothetical protein